MKTFNLGLMISVLILTALLLNLNSCKKQEQNQTNDVISVDDESTIIMNHILDFKEEMEYYHNNPGLKTDYKKEIMQTITDWEASMNMSFCYSYENIARTESYDTIIDIPLISNDSIFMSDVADKYYNEIILIVQQDFFNNQFSNRNKKLILVDLEPVNGGDSLSINAIIGDNRTIESTPKDWYWGELEGVCISHEHQFDLDAAKKLEQNIRNYFNEAPPTGTSWYFLNVERIAITDPTLYRTPEDELNNYEDYLVYYATEDVSDLIEDVKCIENGTEMLFYYQNYVDFTLGWINDTGKEFKDCTYISKRFSPLDDSEYLTHELYTYLGNRFQTEINIPTEDISTY